jgi:hypothetical protein
MKRILLLAMVATTNLTSCKKEVGINPIPSITINVSDIIYHPKGKISVSWKSSGMPAGSYVIAELYTPSANDGHGGYIPLMPQEQIGPPDETQTRNDGQETFTLPGINLQDPDYVPYDKYGKIFKIYVAVQYRSSSSYIETSQYSQFITIVPEGCTSTVGYSSTSGDSCSLPQ